MKLFRGDIVRIVKKVEFNSQGYHWTQEMEDRIGKSAVVRFDCDSADNDTVSIYFPDCCVGIPLDSLELETDPSYIQEMTKLLSKVLGD